MEKERVHKETLEKERLRREKEEQEKLKLEAAEKERLKKEKERQEQIKRDAEEKERKENELTEWENKRLKIETVSKDTELGSNLSDASETFTESELKRDEGGTLFKDPSTLDPEIVHFDAALQCQIKSNDEILTISSGQIEIENSIKEKEGILRYDNISLFEF